MSPCFYDNIEISDESIVSIDRVYGLDFGQFDDEMWGRLSEIYSMLPAQIKVDGAAQPAWFGEEDKHHEYLWASVEPSGLQVVGRLNSADWYEWEKTFHAGIIDFPFFDI